MESNAIYLEAIDRFKALFSRASEGPLREPAAVTLATVIAVGVRVHACASAGAEDRTTCARRVAHACSAHLSGVAGIAADAAVVDVIAWVGTTSGAAHLHCGT